MSERNLLLLLALVIGVSCGFAAVILKKLILWISSFLVGGIVAKTGPWMYVLLPGIGMLLSLLTVKYLVKDNISHGVTKVLLAISRNDSRIKKHNCWSSLLTSALTIGFGGSVGAEAPIVYTGAAIGSNLARALRLPYSAGMRFRCCRCCNFQGSSCRNPVHAGGSAVQYVKHLHSPIVGVKCFGNNSFICFPRTGTFLPGLIQRILYVGHSVLHPSGIILWNRFHLLHKIYALAGRQNEQVVRRLHEVGRMRLDARSFNLHVPSTFRRRI